MRAEWFAGLLVTSMSVIAVSGAFAQDPQPAAPAAHPFAAAEPLSETTLDALSGGSNIVVGGDAMINLTSANASSDNNVFSGVGSGLLSGNVMSNNAGISTGIFNSGNGVGIAVNTNVIINLR